MYSVKEIFYSLQGEGAQSGRPAIFLRFAGCNLWNGREQDRANAICSFCDTDFVGTDGSFGGKYSDATSLVNTLEQLWPKNNTTNRFVICTGGEPLLQMDEVLIKYLHEQQFTIGIETNGRGIDIAISDLTADEKLRWIERPTDMARSAAYCLVLMHSSRRGEVSAYATACPPLVAPLLTEAAKRAAATAQP